MNPGVVLRDACDACHKRKMRCPSEGVGACTNCRRAQRTCQYSPRSDMGRPRRRPDKHAAAIGDPAPSNQPPVSAAAAAVHHEAPIPPAPGSGSLDEHMGDTAAASLYMHTPHESQSAMQGHAALALDAHGLDEQESDWPSSLPGPACPSGELHWDWTMAEWQSVGTDMYGYSDPSLWTSTPLVSPSPTLLGSDIQSYFQHTPKHPVYMSPPPSISTAHPQDASVNPASLENTAESGIQDQGLLDIFSQLSYILYSLRAPEGTTTPLDSSTGSESSDYPFQQDNRPLDRTFRLVSSLCDTVSSIARHDAQWLADMRHSPCMLLVDTVSTAAADMYAHTATTYRDSWRGASQPKHKKKRSRSSRSGSDSPKESAGTVDTLSVSKALADVAVMEFHLGRLQGALRAAYLETATLQRLERARVSLREISEEMMQMGGTQ